MSLDEDDRRALHLLKEKKDMLHKSHRKENVNLLSQSSNSNIITDEEVNDNSHAVLDMHQQKNKPIKPLKPHATHSQGAPL